VLHFPGEDKEHDFGEALKGKLEREDFNFAGVTFPSNFFPSFARRPLKAAHFYEATFNGDAHFSWTTFEGWTNFTKTIFKGKANFEGTSFQEGVNFSEAAFEQGVDFRWASFSKEAKFYGLETFRDPVPLVKFRNTHVEKPELLSFHTVQLRPSWFADVGGLQKFNFTEVQWYGLSKRLGSRAEAEISAINIEDEISNVQKLLEEEGAPASPYGLLAKTCRELYINADDNRDYPTANEFHYWSMEAVRKEGWSRLGLIATLYWALSGYGERPRRAFFVLVGIWLAFAALYLLIGSSPFVLVSLWDLKHLPMQIARDVGFSLVSIAIFLISFLPLPLLPDWDIGKIGQAAMYSLGALVRLDPKPEPEEASWFQFLVIIEGILGPVQIGLLLLAVRRKVMR